MTVVKRSRQSSASGLVSAVEKFIDALATQGEDDAIQDLEKAIGVLKTAAVDSDDFKGGLTAVAEAFEEHELDAYTFKPKSAEGAWGPAEILYVTSTQVLSILKRFGV